MCTRTNTHIQHALVCPELESDGSKRLEIVAANKYNLCMYVCICTHVCVHVHTHTYTTGSCMPWAEVGCQRAAHKQTSTIYLSMYLYVCAYVGMYVYMYKHTHTACSCLPWAWVWWQQAARDRRIIHVYMNAGICVCMYTRFECGAIEWLMIITFTYACMCIYNQYVYIYIMFTFMCIYNQPICMYVYIYVYVHICRRRCFKGYHTKVVFCIYIHTYVLTYMHAYTTAYLLKLIIPYYLRLHANV